MRSGHLRPDVCLRAFIESESDGSARRIRLGAHGPRTLVKPKYRHSENRVGNGRTRRVRADAIPESSDSRPYRSIRSGDIGPQQYLTQRCRHGVVPPSPARCWGLPRRTNCAVRHIQWISTALETLAFNYLVHAHTPDEARHFASSTECPRELWVTDHRYSSGSTGFGRTPRIGRLKFESWTLSTTWIYSPSDCHRAR